MKQSRVLTLKTLIEKEACFRQVKLFKTMFGKSVKVTKTLCLSVYDKFNFQWAAEHLLSEKAREKYNEIEQSAWEKYDEIEQSTWEKYKKETAIAFARCYVNDK